MRGCVYVCVCVCMLVFVCVCVCVLNDGSETTLKFCFVLSKFRKPSSGNGVQESVETQFSKCLSLVKSCGTLVQQLWLSGFGNSGVASVATYVVQQL